MLRLKGSVQVAMYLDLPDDRDKLEQLTGLGGCEVLPGAPSSLGAIPASRALICVAEMGSYQAAAYILGEPDFASWADPGRSVPRTWLLMDQQVADQLCPEAQQFRRYRELVIGSSAEAAAHPDNLIPVARVSRSWTRTQIDTLRTYAAVLRGEKRGRRYRDFLTDAGVRRAAADDLDAIASDLESWIRNDWIAVISLGSDRQHLAGALPPFPAPAPAQATKTQNGWPEGSA